MAKGTLEMTPADHTVLPEATLNQHKCINANRARETVCENCTQGGALKE